MQSPSPSLPHSEVLVGSAFVSASHSTFSSASRGYHGVGRRPHRPDGCSTDAPPPRSIEATEVPQRETEENDTYMSHSSSASCTERSHSSSRRSPPTRRESEDVVQHRYPASASSSPHPHNYRAEMHGSASSSVVEEEEMCGVSRVPAASDASSAFSSPAPLAPISSDARDSPLPSLPSSTPPPRVAASPGHGSSATPSLSPDDPLAALAPEQVEASLQLYVERGGIHVNEVPAMLRVLPWCTSTTPTAVARSGDEDDEHEDGMAVSDDAWDDAEQQQHPLLDPEAWLGAVAAATAAAGATATVSEGAEHTLPVPAPVTVTPAHQQEQQQEQQQQYTRAVSPPSPLPRQVGPTLGERTVERQRDTAGDVVSARTGASSAGAEGDDGERFTERRLAFEDDEGGAVEAAAAPLPHLARSPHPSRRGSHPHAPPLPLQLHASLGGSDARPPRTPLSTSSSSASPLLRVGDARWPSCVSPTTGATATAHLSSSPSTSGAAAATAAAAVARPMSATAALTGAAAMRSVFQMCLQTPLATASAMLTGRDWYALVDRLRHEGRHKLPPQPILDDVAHTIARTLGSDAHRGAGLNLTDFTRIIQRQLEEVRVDMTASPEELLSSSSASTSTVALRFPAHPLYVLAVPATTLHATQRVSRCSLHATTTVSGAGQWRVLPTWCMALAGLFPLEMSSVCPVPVVRYLRSTGLLRAVLEAVVQRLQLEVDALPESAAPATAPAVGADVRRTSHGSGAATKFVWPPQREAAVRGGSSDGIAAPAAASGAGAAVEASRRPLSAGGGQRATWPEQPVWGPQQSGAPRAAGPAPPKRGGGGSAVATTPTTTVSSAPSRYLDERPLDELGASAVARAKARRLMDTLRRHTVPINRYECFARVEQEDEPVQQALCFVSRKELEATFSGGGGDGGDGDGDDSDAMSDMVAALTYDPAEETMASLSVAAAKAPGGAGGDADQTRSSLRPPLLPRMSASNVLPTIISGATRAATPARRRVSSMSGAGTAPSSASVLALPSTMSGRGGSIVSTAGAAAAAPPPAPPPPVPGMFRMSGVLATALPRRQEAALVRRLSKPVCDPVAMSLRTTAFSAGGAATRSRAIAATPTAPVASTAHRPDGPTPASRPHSGAVGPRLHHRHHPGAPSSATHASQRESNPSPSDGWAPASWHRQHSQHSRPSSAWTDHYCASVCASHQPQLSSPPTPPPPPPHASAAPLQLTEEQNRGFFFFDVPRELVAAPLSACAAATAAALVIGGGTAAASRHSPRSHSPSRGKAGGAMPARARRGVSSRWGLSPHAVASRGTRGADGRVRITRAAAETITTPYEPHVSLFERRLHRQLQLAYASEHPYPHNTS
ncbi:hypothetical protein NESM_000410300 [Novymonas esmeraldas]|uniref:Uncharacterized protein n=1 Tax=Novymonas esmeraldas TaxID=1808958 RepID=A0AAW0EL97_9TRYP